MSSLDPTRKILLREEASDWRRGVGRLVFTNGVFDLLHSGHIDVLRAARQHGDALIVGVNDDASVRRLKGNERPIRSVGERMYVLAALLYVDAVTEFSEDTPLELIKQLRPEVLVKGGDYSMDSVVGAEEVLSWGGEVVIVPLTLGQSTTNLIERLRERG